MKETIESVEMPGYESSLRIVSVIAVAWSCFQLWIASPLPFWLNLGVFNDTESRSIHLAFATTLVFLCYTWRRVRDHKFHGIDACLAAIAGFCSAYLFLFYHELSMRSGDPSTLDIVTGSVGMVLLLEATRRALGWPLTIIAGVFLFYTFAGPWMPQVIAFKGASLSRMLSHQWLSTEGVFGIALGVSTNFVFLFVLFGTLLERAGAGNYFMQIAFALLGHLRGGPAKAAVLASGLTGMISGSSIANVVTTGTFTIPLMKKVGFPDYKAGAIEVASSTNGQILPPVMGAAAFIMTEYVNIPYTTLMKHAFLPAVLSYLALIYVVHLEAVKADMTVLHKSVSKLKHRFIAWGLTISGLIVLASITYYALAFLQNILGSYAPLGIITLLIAAYLCLLHYARQHPTPDISLGEITTVPKLSNVLPQGLFYFLPIVVLVWCLMIHRLSPSLSIFYATSLLIFINLTRAPIYAFWQGNPIIQALKKSALQLLDSFRQGGLNMMGIGVATATAGIVVGTVSLTGIGQLLMNVIEVLSMGSLPLMLLLTALFCMILGMGLPTTANYIVVASLMAPVLVELASIHGYVLPLVAVHLFVFYFGVMADDTPPVGLAAIAAAAISHANPIKTGIQSFTYDIRTAVLPFMFIFNQQLIFIGINSVPEFLWVVLTALTAMLLFVAAIQRYWICRCRIWESVALLLIAFCLFRPDFLQNLLYPPFHSHPANRLPALVQQSKPLSPLRLHVIVDDGFKKQKRVFQLQIPASTPNTLKSLGIAVENREHNTWIRPQDYGGIAEQAGLNALDENQLISIETSLPQPAKPWFTLPAWLLLSLIFLLQRRRKSLISLAKSP